MGGNSKIQLPSCLCEINDQCGGIICVIPENSKSKLHPAQHRRLMERKWQWSPRGCRVPLLCTLAVFYKETGLRGIFSVNSYIGIVLNSMSARHLLYGITHACSIPSSRL